MDTVMTQTISQRLKRPRIYGEKEEKALWEKYHSWGKASSTTRLREWANAQGMYSHEKGEVSQMGPFLAMWRYAFRHPEEAYPHWKAWVDEHRVEADEAGIEGTFEEFKEEIKNQVKKNHIFVPDRLRAWCQKWKVTYY